MLLGVAPIIVSIAIIQHVHLKVSVSWRYAERRMEREEENKVSEIDGELLYEWMQNKMNATALSQSKVCMSFCQSSRILSISVACRRTGLRYKIEIAEKAAC